MDGRARYRIQKDTKEGAAGLPEGMSGPGALRLPELLVICPVQPAFHAFTPA